MVTYLNRLYLNMLPPLNKLNSSIFISDNAGSEWCYKNENMNAIGCRRDKSMKEKKNINEALKKKITLETIKSFNLFQPYFFLIHDIILSSLVGFLFCFHAFCRTFSYNQFHDHIFILLFKP